MVRGDVGESAMPMVRGVCTYSWVEAPACPSLPTSVAALAVTATGHPWVGASLRICARKISSGSQSLALSQPSKPLAQLVEIIRIGTGVGRRCRVAKEKGRRGSARLQDAGMPEITSSATGAGWDERPDAGSFVGIAAIGFHRGHRQGGTAQKAAQHRLPPVQTCLFEFPGLSIQA